jgi:hypothetical protein
VGNNFGKILFVSEIARKNSENKSKIGLGKYRIGSPLIKNP